MRLGNFDHLLIKLDAELSDDARYIDIADQIRDIINNAPTVPLPDFKEGYKQAILDGQTNFKRPQGDIKKYKPLEPDYNVQCAVENLKTAYWSNEPEKDAKNFTEAENIIISAICHHGYTVCKQPQGEWIYGEDECGQDGWFCSECGFFVPWYYQYYENDINFIREYKACPHCLAEMVTYTGKDRDSEVHDD